MDRNRIVTALVLAPIAVLIALGASSGWIALLYGILIILGAFEWSGFIQASIVVRVLFAVLVMAAILVLWRYRPTAWMTLTHGIAIGWILGPILLIWRRTPINHFWTLTIGFVALIAAWCALVALAGPFEAQDHLLLAFLLLVWGADSGAYIIGRTYGRHPLAPRISPHKTWEGLGGGALAVSLAILILWLFLGIDFWAGCFLGGVVFIFAIIGDLFESCFKRWGGLKDSGRLFPGHGGVLDRIDSWIAAAPVFLICSRWLFR